MVLTSTVVLTILIAHRPAFAQSGAPDGKADEPARLAEAERACLEGNFQKGVEILTALYLISRHPIYLHNQARCYEQNGQYRLAAGRYREFLRKLRELPPEQVTAETQLTPDKVAALEAHTARLEQESPDRRPGAPPIDANAAAQPELLPPTVAATLPPSAPPAGAGRGGAGWRAAGTALMVAGGLGLASSVAAGLWVKKTEQEVAEASTRGGQTFDAGQYRTGERVARIATVGFIAAPLVAVAGALAYWRGATARNEARASLLVAPAFARGELGLHVALLY